MWSRWGETIIIWLNYIEGLYSPKTHTLGHPEADEWQFSFSRKKWRGLQRVVKYYLREALATFPIMWKCYSMSREGLKNYTVWQTAFTYVRRNKKNDDVFLVLIILFFRMARGLSGSLGFVSRSEPCYFLTYQRWKNVNCWDRHP